MFHYKYYFIEYHIKERNKWLNQIQNIIQSNWILIFINNDVKVWSCFTLGVHGQIVETWLTHTKLDNNNKVINWNGNNGEQVEDLWCCFRPNEDVAAMSGFLAGDPRNDLTEYSQPSRFVSNVSVPPTSNTIHRCWNDDSEPNRDTPGGGKMLG